MQHRLHHFFGRHHGGRGFRMRRAMHAQESEEDISVGHERSGSKDFRTARQVGQLTRGAAAHRCNLETRDSGDLGSLTAAVLRRDCDPGYRSERGSPRCVSNSR
jgi:hypothetical protein